MRLRLLHGDCKARMAALLEGSIQVVCCDPPYGLEFMGKEWDKLEPARNTQRWAGSDRRNLIGDGSGKGGTFDQRLNELPSYRPPRNPKCKLCGHYKFSGSPCGCPQPDWDLRLEEHGSFLQDWHREWLREVLRVLEPGGVIKTFGGTRVFHRLAAAMQDVGFTEIRLEAWGYGSGFPKSLNVGKAIDKRPGAVQHYAAIKAFLAAAIAASPKTRSQIDAECGFAACDFARMTGSSPFVNVIPDADKWVVMKAVIGFGDGWDAAIQAADREVVGQGKSGTTAIWSEGHMGDYDITAASSDPAKVWDGWGTALKPAWEPVLVGVKP